MRYQESGLRLLLCTSLPRYLLRVIGNLCEQRGGGLDALDRSGLFVSRGGGGLRFSRTRAATLSIAPIKKLPSLSFGPVLYYVEHKVHRSFFPFFLFSLSSLSLFSWQLLLPTPSKEIPSISPHPETIRIGERRGDGREG